VDLPDPDTPSTAVNEPAANDSDTRSSAATAPRRRPYRFVTSLSTTGAAAAVPSSVSVGFPVSMTMLASLRAGLARANGAARRLGGGGFPDPVRFGVKLNTRELGLHRAERVASRATDRPNLSG